MEDEQMSVIFPASIFDQGATEKTGDGFRQLSGTLDMRGRKRQTPLQAMALHAKLLKKLRPTPQGMLGKYRVTETRFHQALDRFGVGGFHQHARSDTNLIEKPVDDEPYVASLRIEQKWDPGEFRSLHRADLTAAHLVCRGAYDEKFFVKKRNEL